MRIRQIDEGERACAIQLETLGVGRQPNVGEPAAAPRIDHRKPALAIACDEAFAKRVHVQIVRVAAERQRSRVKEVRGAKKGEHAVARVRDCHELRLRRGGETLRSVEPGDPSNDFPGREIDRVHAIVAELGDEKAPVRDIDGHVIDSTRHPAKGDRRFENEHRACGGARPSHGDESKHERGKAKPVAPGGMQLRHVHGRSLGISARRVPGLEPAVLPVVMTGGQPWASFWQERHQA